MAGSGSSSIGVAARHGISGNIGGVAASWHQQAINDAAHQAKRIIAQRKPAASISRQHGV